jgi:hypothetical protein
VRDPQHAASVLLRVTLWAGAFLVMVAGALNVGGGGWAEWGQRVARVGIGVVIAGPFLTLVAIAATVRRGSVTAYAMVTIAIALIGAFLAR